MTVDESVFFANSCYISAIVLITYDTLLTFSRGLIAIWKRRLSAVSIIFVVQWYCTLCEMVLDLTSPARLWSCKILVVIEDVLEILALFAIALFPILRIWAIYGRRLFPSALVFVCCMFIPCVNIYSVSRPRNYIIEGGDCIVALTQPIPKCLPFVTRAIPIASSILVLGLTWLKTIDTWKMSVQIKHFKPSVTVLLPRDGTAYFLAILVLNVVTLLLDVFVHNPANGASAFIYVTNAVTVNLMTRFLLDLRSVFYSGSSDDHMTSVRFTRSLIIANFGAPLDHDLTWVTGSADNIENERNEQFEVSDSPPSAGLIRAIPISTSEGSSDRGDYLSSRHRLNDRDVFRDIS